MQHLPLDAVRAFLSIYELQSYTAAGQQLGRSQPAISLQLNRLEEMLGNALLQRSAGRISLTQAGAEFIESARSLINLNDQILARFTEPSLSGRVRLGIPSEFASKLLPQVLGQFAAAYPNITLAVTSALSKELLREDNASFDIIIALIEPELRVNRAGLLELKHEPLVWVGPQADYLPVGNTLQLVMAPEGCIYRRRALAAFKQLGKTVRISYTNADFSGLTAAIGSGLGITVLAQSTVPDNLARLQRSSLAHDLPELGDVSVVMKLTDGDNQAAKQLAQFIRERI
jgi:DNA-binding transcriptional LysR family regulator